MIHGVSPYIEYCLLPWAPPPKLKDLHFHQENMLHLIVALLLATLISLAWKVFNLTYLKPRRIERILRAQGLGGNSYRPFVGDVKEWRSMLEEASSKPITLSDDILPRVIPFLCETVQKYGANPFVWVGAKPLVIIKDPELIREVLQKNMTFTKPDANAMGKLLVQGLVVAEGDKWTKHRKIISPAFSLDKIKLMLPAFHICAKEMVIKWEASLSPVGFCDLDVWPFLQALTTDVISRAAFGSNYEEGRKIFELQKEQANSVIEIGQTLDIPGMRYMPTERNRRMIEIARIVEETIRDIIGKRLRAVQAGEPAKDDLLGILLESNHREIEEHGSKKFGMSIKDVVEECKLFYYAGQETTATLLVWAMVLLAKHHKWQSLAREEVFQIFGENEIHYDGLNHLKVMTMILHETLRLYPSVATLTRRVLENTTIGNLFLPSGVMLSLQLILLHHDREIWGDDAKAFKPERFSEGLANATKGQVSYLPFGWGPRMCPGQNFSMTEAKLVLAMILQRFAFKLSPYYLHAPFSVITVQPQSGAQLILRKL